MEEDIFVTITGLNFCYGMKPFAIGNIIRLVKEPGNPYDAEAVRAEMPFIGRVGYAANSPHTMAQGTYSAGRLYDKMGDAVFARVMFTTQTKVIARVEWGLKKVVEVSQIQETEHATKPEKDAIHI